MDPEPKNYELAYLLSPSIPEGETLTHTAKLTTLIEEHKGIIRHAQEPKKRPLAYAVKKQKNAYFGWITFRMNPEAVAGLEKKIKTESHPLRFVIFQEEEGELRPPMILRPPLGKPRAPAQQPIAPLREPMPKPERLDLEALDRKLEEILGK